MKNVQVNTRFLNIMENEPWYERTKKSDFRKTKDIFSEKFSDHRPEQF
jgi:hypothetical protein